MNPKRNKDLDRCESVLGDMIISCQNHKRGMSDREKMPPCPEYDLYNIRDQALITAIQALEENKRLRGVLKEIVNVEHSVEWHKVESAKYTQSRLYHEVRDIAKNALETLEER